MKRLTLSILAFMLIALFLSSALSEGFESFQQAIESIAAGSAPDGSLDALLASLSDTVAPGAAFSQTWEGADGGTYTFVYYSETTVIDPSAPQAMENAPTAQELLNMVDWVETQVHAEAAEPAPEIFDPAVFCTAQPQAVPAVDPAVFSTARPQTVQAVDPAVFSTARPQATQPPTMPPVPAPTPRPENTPTVSTGDYTTFDSSMQEQILLNLLNQDRARNGLPPLVLDPELSRLAQLKSNDMNANHYFAHESPTYGNAGQMLDSFHYDYEGVGENIAHHSNVEKAEAAFMSSDGHRRNILGSQWEKVGLGVAYDENGNVYVTQLFAR